MRPLLLAGLLAARLAQAQDVTPPPAPPPAEAAPTQPLPAVTPPPLPPPSPAPAGPDTELLRALLGATQQAPEELRVIAIEDLALLGDPRALDPLAALVWDPNPRIQAAVVRAVALFQEPRAEQILSNVVRHPSLPEPLKLQALGGLLYQRTASARAVVEDASRNPRYSVTVQSAALAVAARWDASAPSPESPK
ncbi:HEAT repeat domain-containing protein [Myxococcaceae bacterium GXIMD 01537]